MKLEFDDINEFDKVPGFQSCYAGMEQSWYFNELPEGNNDVMVVCEEHITKLAALVNECESLFTF